MASHSHHFWPDSAKEGILESWKMASTLSDDKWGFFFDNLLPKVQEIISSQIKFSRPSDIAFASNTHELLSRLISSFPTDRPITILTSDSEFHSFNRQIQRLDELNSVRIIQAPTDDLNLFEDQILHTLKTKHIDLIFLSQTFYNSSKILSNSLIEKIINQKKKETIFALDGYHAYCAIDVDIQKFENDLYYLAGGYKYAQAGEGICFMTLPSDCQLRPLYTGWFASFETLEQPQDKVQYSDNGMRFWGATIDQTAFYRFKAIWENFASHALTHYDFIKHAKTLQAHFIKDNPFESQIVERDLSLVGNFISIAFESDEQTRSMHEKLKKRGILTDFRGNILRFGFAPYISEDEVSIVKSELKSLHKTS